MKNTHTSAATQNKNIIRVFAGTALVSLIPLLVMQFSDEIKWSLGDFIAVGILLIGTGLIYELGVKKVNSANIRTLLSIALFMALALIWVELAVGILGTPVAGT